MKSRAKTLKRALKLVKGIVIKWEDDDPLSDAPAVDGGEVSHKNPLMRLMAKDLYRGYGEWLVFEQPLRWLIKICVIFRYENGIDQREERELEGYSTISGLNEFCMQEIEDAFKHGNIEKYVTTQFCIECVGIN